MDDNLNPLEVERDNIWQYRQNKIKYVARDISSPNFSPTEENVRKVLLARGFNKWIANRSDIIRLKNDWRDEITALRLEIEKTPQGKERQRLVGRMEGLTKARADVRAVCHSERWRFPE